MKIKINPKSVSSGIISSLLREKLQTNLQKHNVKQGVSLVDIANKVVAKRFPKEEVKESDAKGGLEAEKNGSNQ